MAAWTDVDVNRKSFDDDAFNNIFNNLNAKSSWGQG